MSETMRVNGVRYVVEDGEPWFVVRDVANILGAHTDTAVDSLPEDHVRFVGERRSMTDEDGFARLVESALDGADAARRVWVRHWHLDTAARASGSFVPDDLVELTAAPDASRRLSAVLGTVRNVADSLDEDSRCLEDATCFHEGFLAALRTCGSDEAAYSYHESGLYALRAVQTGLSVSIERLRGLSEGAGS